MSILNYARRAVKQTRPATIRPVPATFGLGILPDFEPCGKSVDVCRMTDAEFEVYLYRNTKPSDLAAVKAAEKRSSHPVLAPSTIDRIWNSGYALGESGYEVHEVSAPKNLTTAESEAFMAGVSRGAIDRWKQFALDMAELGWDGSGVGYEPEEHELAECGSAVGH